MRELTGHKVNGCNEAITIHVLDQPGRGGACHHYRITHPGPVGPINPNNDPSYSEIYFQNGPIKEVGTNGITHEALLAILIDRLQGFQSGPYACDENALALAHIKTAQAILHERTQKRLARGVEGTHQL